MADKNSQFNLKNVDAAQLTRAISEHQNTAVKLVLIVGTFVMVILMFNDNRTKEFDIHQRMSQVQKKLSAIKDRDAAAGNFNNFKASLPKKLNEFELITLISDYAKSCHVTISSLSPAESKDMGLYDAINVSFEAVSDDFKDMMLFLRKIEKSNFPLRVNSWSGRENVDGTIGFTVETSAVLIHT